MEKGKGVSGGENGRGQGQGVSDLLEKLHLTAEEAEAAVLSDDEEDGATEPREFALIGKLAGMLGEADRRRGFSLQSVLRSFPSPLVASSEPARIALVQSEVISIVDYLVTMCGISDCQLMQLQILLEAFLFIRETCAAGLKAMVRRLEVLGSMCPNLRGVVADILTWFSIGTRPIQTNPGSIETELLDIYAFELRFHLQPNTRSHVGLSLTNKTDDDVSFWIIPSNPHRYVTPQLFSGGSVSPRSTCHVTVRMKEHLQSTNTMDELRIIMMTSMSLQQLGDEFLSDISGKRDEVFKYVREMGGKAHEVSVVAFACDPERASIIPLLSIPSEHLSNIKCIDVHPTEPWILTGHKVGNVCIWKIKPQDGSHEMVSIKKHKNEDYCVASAVRFVARKQWVIVGDNYGNINVYEYGHKTLVQTIYRAHQGMIRSLAVHPTRPYLLSSSDDKSIKLWNWDNKWEQIRQFEERLSPVLQVMFSPKDTGHFASVSNLFLAKKEMRRTSSNVYSGSPANIKIWSINSDKPESYFSGSFTSVDFCLTGSDQQSMVVCKKDGNTEIREQAKGRVIDMLETPLRTGEVIITVACHPSLPILVAGTQFGRVLLWNLTMHRLEQEQHFRNGRIKGFGFMDVQGSNRLVIGYKNTIELLEINLPTLASQK
ncbi:hypothetical protein ACP70R_048149 [Stipagrostis hirtigluma subsp. patula]